ncbi:MAG: hypothetical protein ACLP7P_14660 [Rhodomicrobium sp.]
MADKPVDLTQKILIDIQERLGRNEKDQVTILETVVEMAKTVNATAEVVTELNGRTEVVEGRLNSIDARLARIEKHTGLVSA